MNEITAKKQDKGISLKLLDYMTVPEIKNRVLPVIKQFEKAMGVHPLQASNTQLIEFLNKIKATKSAATYNYKIAMLQKAEDIAYEFDLIDDPKLRYLRQKKAIKSLKIERHHVMKITAGEVVKFYKTGVVQSWLKGYIQLLIATGMRQNAALNLKYSDITLVEQSTTNGTERFYTLSVIEKRDKARSIPVQVELMDSILQKVKTDIDNPNGYLFVSPAKNECHISRQGVDQLLKKWWKELFNKSVSSHDFRRFFANLHIEKGTSLLQLSKMLGHASIYTTEIYVSVYTKPENFNIDLEDLSVKPKETIMREVVRPEVESEMVLDDIERELADIDNEYLRG